MVFQVVIQKVQAVICLLAQFLQDYCDSAPNLLNFINIQGCGAMIFFTVAKKNITDYFIEKNTQQFIGRVVVYNPETLQECFPSFAFRLNYRS